MNEIPEEFELMSFFENEPKKQDIDVPFYYNLLKYVVTSENERIEVNISPSFGDIEIFWEQNNNLKFNWRLYDICSLKIEKKDKQEYLVIKFNAKNISDCYLWVKPNFKIIGGMNIYP